MRRIMTSDPQARRPVWWLPIVLSIVLSGVISFTRDCSRSDKATAERLTRLEQKVDDNDATTHDKIDHIQSQVDKLVEWALGHK